MVDAIAGRAEQLEQEQRSIEAMYARLDAERTEHLTARTKLLASSVHAQGGLHARDAEVSRLTDAAGRLRMAEPSLCFGRIDGSGDAPPLHVGRIGLRSASGDVLLVDWRAEAARPFYEATLAAPLGLRRRRHLRVAERTVLDLNDEILDGSEPTSADVLGDAPLAAMLRGARTGRMREAASTLQREQDEIVRSENRGITVVDGGPGTGKTIVALHRAAYVLYRFPAIAEYGVLVFGPNDRFLDYISDVLPSLGENDVALAVAADLVGVVASRIEPDAVTRAKGSSQFAAALARQVRAHQPRPEPLLLRTAHGEVTLDAARVDAARRSALQGGVGHNAARALFLEQIVEELVSDLEQQTAQENTDFEQDLKEFSGIDLDRMFGRRPGDADADDLHIDWDRIREELLVDAGMDRIIDGVWPRLHADSIVRTLLTDRARLASTFRDLEAEHVDAIAAGASAGQGWTLADLALLDEARALVDGPPARRYGHIVVDEAQQLSEMQWRMLMRRCPSRSMTVVGDLAQRGPTTTVATWKEALAPFVGAEFDHRTLTINYRTTTEILESTAALLNRIAPTQRLSRSLRHGEEPVSLPATETHLSGSLRALLTRLRDDHPDELIGVISTTGRAADLGALGGRVEVVPAADARGLEFDTVIVVDPDGIRKSGEAGLRDLYVARTRATKRLIEFTIVPS